MQQYLFWPISQSNGNKNKNEWYLSKLKSCCTAKGIIYKNKKTTHRMGEDICKWCNQQRLAFNIFKHLMQLSIIKAHSPVRKWAEDLKRDIALKKTYRWVGGLRTDAQHSQLPKSESVSHLAVSDSWQPLGLSEN